MIRVGGVQIKLSSSGIVGEQDSGGLKKGCRLDAESETAFH